MKKIMVIAGSKWQIPITKKIKSMGHLPYVVNLYEDSPAFEFAEKSGVMDILDKKTCLEFAEQNNVDAVLSEECDIAMPTVAYIADSLDLPSQSADIIPLFTNKFAMREFCMAHGLKSPEYRKCASLPEAIEFFKSVNGKIIIKPLDANSSRGVYTITCEEELLSCFDKAMSYSKVEKCVLAERYIEGTEFTVDGIKTPDKHFSLAISEKKHYPHNKNIAYELYFSHKNPNFDYEKLRGINDEYVNLSGLPFGLTHAEYKCENGEFYLIEIAARGGGNLISSDIVPVMSGIDNYEYLIDCSIGNAENKDFVIDENLSDRCCVLHFFDAPADGGIVEAVEGTEILDNHPGIVTWELNFKRGDYIEKAADDSKRIGFYIAYADSDAGLRQLMSEIESSFKIRLS